MFRVVLIAVLFTIAHSANANLQIKFVESAPKDKFVVTNISDCSVDGIEIDIDLVNSNGGLIFDTSATGAGVEVFQPFESISSELALVKGSLDGDGDRSLSIVIDTLQVNASAGFTIDVDDTLTNSSLGQIRVTGSEIEGGQVRVRGVSSTTIDATFDANGLAIVSLPSCA